MEISTRIYNKIRYNERWEIWTWNMNNGVVNWLKKKTVDQIRHSGE